MPGRILPQCHSSGVPYGRHALAADGRPGRFTVGTGGEGGKRVTEGGQAREERDVKPQR